MIELPSHHQIPDSQSNSIFNLGKPTQTFQGGLNTSFIFQSESQRSLVLRTPKPTHEVAQTVSSIQAEYDAIGATGQGIGFRIRSMTEQARFMRQTAQKGLNTVDYLEVSDNALLMEFIPGTILSRVVGTDTSPETNHLVQQVLTNLVNAHQQAIVFGDRWVTNTMVTPDQKFVEMDFDLALTGEVPVLSAFELSQTLYHLMHFADKNRLQMTNTILAAISNNPQAFSTYRQELIQSFTLRQTEFFYDNYVKSGTLYEGLVPPEKEVTHLVNSMKGIV